MSTRANSRFRENSDLLLLLEKAKERLESSLDHFPGLYCLLDQSGTILRGNELAIELGLSGNIFPHLTSTSTALLAEAMQDSSKKKSIMKDLELELASGQVFSVALNAWQDRQYDESHYFVLVGKDLTELQRALKEKERLAREVTTAQQLQALMVPIPKLDVNGFEVISHYQPAAECGGDFLFYDWDQGLLRLWAGDVTGHGVGPAMITGAIKSAVSMQKGQTQKPMSESLEQLNQCVAQLAQGLYWMTFHLIQFDPSRKKMTIGQASHTPVYCLKSEPTATQSWKDVEEISTGPTHPLGTTEDPVFIVSEHPIENGTLYFSFSDGLYEQANEEGKVYGLRRLLGSVVESYQKSQDLQKTRDLVLADFRKYTGGVALGDDLTFWMVLFKGQ